MVMWKMRGCPKCGGDIFLDIDGNTLLDHCLQCGYVNPKPKEVCPHCSLEMITDKYEDDEFYYCIKCGYKDELHKVSS